MIDWPKTTIEYGYSNSRELRGLKRPKVICRCDQCGKERVIQIRVKSRIVNEQMQWLCHACVGLGIACKLSESTTNSWKNPEYRDKQLQRKQEQQYKELQSDAITKLWSSPKYRTKLEIGIRVDDYIEKCYGKHKGKFTYDRSSFVDWKTKISIICNDCGCKFNRKPLQHYNTGHCPGCGVSSGQKELFEYLLSKNANPRLNDRQTLNGLELDIYSEEHKLAIEYHGLYWHSYNTLETKDQIYRHQRKAIMSAAANITLLQFYEHELVQSPHLLMSIIDHKLGLSKKFDARKTKLKILTTTESMVFFRASHLQGYRPAKTTIALYYGDNILQAASFSPYKNGYEIIRLATAPGCCVRGGASKILNEFCRVAKPTQIYTFADLRISNANVYKQIGFNITHITKPGYFYYKKRNGSHVILPRQQCQKHKLAKLLGKKYDQTLSEANNMFANRYRRVWTAGNISLLRMT